MGSPEAAMSLFRRPEMWQPMPSSVSCKLRFTLAMAGRTAACASAEA